MEMTFHAMGILKYVWTSGRSEQHRPTADGALMTPTIVEKNGKLLMTVGSPEAQPLLLLVPNDIKCLLNTTLVCRRRLMRPVFTPPMVTDLITFEPNTFSTQTF
jgi:hypothetical protein